VPAIAEGMEKYPGSEYDRASFVEQRPSVPIRLAVGFLAVATVAVAGFVGYRVLMQSANTPGEDGPALLQVQQQVMEIEGRLERLEQNQKRIAAAVAVAPASTAPKVVAAAPSQNDSRNLPRVTYSYTISPPTAEHEELQRGLGAVQNQTAANHEALQAASDRLAQVAGQVGAQQGQILRNQNELDQLLARTEHATFSFELRRGQQLQAVGPLHLSLKDSSQRKQRYTLCVYVQDSCTELRDRSPYELVQLGGAPNTVPFEVIVTQVGKDQVKGYLEVPREGTAH
jgi:hypothetical protein